MAGAPGYVHISQRARAAAATQMAAGAEGMPLQRRGARRPAGHEAEGAPQQVRADRRLNPQEQGGVSTEARGFVLYVGLDESKAAANGTTLVEVVQQLRRPGPGPRPPRPARRPRPPWPCASRAPRRPPQAC